MRITVSSDPGDFADVWPDLAAMSGPAPDFHGFPFQASDYLAVWQSTIGTARRTRPIFVRVDGAGDRPWLLAPLGIEERRGVKLLGFLDGGVVDYAAPIVFPANAEAVEAAEVWAAIFDALPAFDVTNLEKGPDMILGAANPLYAERASDASDDGHCMPLEGNWETFEKDRPSRRSRESRRRRRRLSERGVLQFSIAAGEAERAEMMSAMVRQKTRRYIETRGVDGFERPGYRAYFAALTERFAEQGVVHLSALKVDETIIATHWGLVSGERYYYLMPASESGEWQKFSPGILLLEDLIQWSYANGLKMFDFGVGDEPYKFEFAPVTQHLQRVVRGHSLLGKTLVPTWRTLRRARHRLRRAPQDAPAEGA